MKLFPYLAAALISSTALTARADESVAYGCRVQTSHGTYQGTAETRSEAARYAYLSCQDDARNTKWHCYGAWLAARCVDLTD